MSRAASSPPVHDSPTPSRRPSSRRSDLLLDRAAVGREHGVAVALGDQGHERVGGRLGRPVRTDHDLELAAAQAGRDLQPVEPDLARPRPAASPRSRTRGSRTGASSSGGSAARRLPPPGRARSPPPAPSSPAARAAGPGSTTTTCPPAGTTRPGAVPTGSSATAPSGTIACLRFAIWSASGSRFQRRAKRAMISPMRRSSASSSRSGRPAKSRHDLRGEVVRGRPQAAARDDQVRAFGAHELQRREQVGRAGRR